MKLQVSFDMSDLEKALTIATQIAEHVDIIEVGTILLYEHGIAAVQKFKAALPNSVILADCKIADRGKDIVSLFARAGSDWVTVMAGTGHEVIHTACSTAHELKKKVMLDLIDASSPDQIALEAKNLGADAILFHQPFDEQNSLVFLEKWEMFQSNASLPIFISAKIDQHNIHQFITLNPHGILIGNAITDAENPAEQAAYFSQLVHKG